MNDAVPGKAVVQFLYNKLQQYKAFAPKTGTITSIDGNKIKNCLVDIGVLKATVHKMLETEGIGEVSEDMLNRVFSSQLKACAENHHSITSDFDGNTAALTYECVSDFPKSGSKSELFKYFHEEEVVRETRATAPVFDALRAGNIDQAQAGSLKYFEARGVHAIIEPSPKAIKENPDAKGNASKSGDKMNSSHSPIAQPAQSETPPTENASSARSAASGPVLLDQEASTPKNSVESSGAQKPASLPQEAAVPESANAAFPTVDAVTRQKPTGNQTPVSPSPAINTTKNTETGAGTKKATNLSNASTGLRTIFNKQNFGNAIGNAYKTGHKGEVFARVGGVALGGTATVTLINKAHKAEGWVARLGYGVTAAVTAAATVASATYKGRG